MGWSRNMLYSGFDTLPRSVFWSADFNGRSNNTDVIVLNRELFQMQTRQDLDFGKRHFVLNAIGFSATLIAFLVSALALTWSKVLGLVGFTITAIIFGAYIALEQTKIHGYKCKQCGSKLEQDWHPEDREIFYACSDCNIKWHVGLSMPD